MTEPHTVIYAVVAPGIIIFYCETLFPGDKWVTGRNRFVFRRHYRGGYLPLGGRDQKIRTYNPHIHTKLHEVCEQYKYKRAPCDMTHVTHPFCRQQTMNSIPNVDCLV